MFSKDKSKEPPRPSATEAKVSSKASDLTIARPKVNPKSSMPSIISDGLHIAGNLSSDGDIQVDGRIEGDIEARSLTIGENGIVEGSIIADEVHVSGSLNGEINARTVIIARSAHVRGDVAHDVLSIESGAQFEGKSARRAGIAPSQPTATATTKPQPTQTAQNKPLLTEVSASGSTKAATSKAASVN